MCTLDISTGIGKFPREPYKFPKKVPIHVQDAFHEEMWNLEQLRILELVKEVTEWVNNFVIMEKKV